MRAMTDDGGVVEIGPCRCGTVRGDHVHVAGLDIVPWGEFRAALAEMIRRRARGEGTKLVSSVQYDSEELTVRARPNRPVFDPEAEASANFFRRSA